VIELPDLTRCERNFLKLLSLLPQIDRLPLYARGTAAGKQDVHVFVLEKSEGYRLIQISQRREDSGATQDVCRAVGIGVFLKDQLAEAVTYRDFRSFERAYVEEDEPPVFEVHTRLNNFLEGWLESLIEQGYSFPQM